MSYKQNGKDNSAREKIARYMATQRMAVFSTISQSGKIESAAMAFSETDGLELIFQTPNTTRKYINLKANPQVAVVIGWDEDERLTIQYEGLAEEVSVDEIEKYRIIHLNKNPRSKRYAYLQENKYFIVTPKWIRLTDLNTNPPTLSLLEF